MVRCWGSELFFGLRSVTRVLFCMCFHHTNFVCGSAIQVGIAIAVHCILVYWYGIFEYSTSIHVYMYCWISARELVRRLVGSMVSTHEQRTRHARVRIPLPAMSIFQRPVLISDS